MGIGGVTYTDGRGRKRSLDVNSLEDFKAQFGAAAHTPRGRVTPQLPVPGAAQPQPNAAPDAMPGSAVVNTRNGLALRGEENDPTVPGKKVYGSVNGVKGYHTLDEIDPLASGGRRVGHDGSVNDASDEEPDGDSVQGFDGQGFDVPLASRIALAGGEDGIYTLYQFSRDLRFSSGRRAGGVTAEEKKEIGTIVIPDGGGGADEDYPFKVKNFGTDEEPNWGIHLPTNCIRVGGNYAEDGDFKPDLVPMESEDGTDMGDWCKLDYADGRVYLRIESMYDYEYSQMMESPQTSGDVPDDRKKLVRIVSCSFTDSTDGGDDEYSGTHIDYIEICNIVDGVPYQKTVGAIDIPGPIPEPRADPLSGDLTDGAADVIQMRRHQNGAVHISAPIQLVPGTSNVSIRHISPGSSLDAVGHRFVISVDDSGGGGGGGDSTEPDNISVDFTGNANADIESGAGGGAENGGESGGGEDPTPTPTPTPESHKLQIKDWDNGDSDDEDNSLASLLTPVTEVADSGSGASEGGSSEGGGSERENYELVVRKTEDEQEPKSLKYLPLGDFSDGFVTVATNQTITGVKTFATGTGSGAKKIVLDPSAIPSGCNGTIRVHELEVPKNDGSGNSDVYHILACDDIRLPAAASPSHNHDSKYALISHTHPEYVHPATQTITVITDISFDFDSNNQLVAKLKKSTLTVHGAVEVTGTTDKTIPLYRHSFVDGAVYSESDKTFKLKRVEGIATASSPTETTDSTPVFTAVSHDDEYGSN